MEPHKAQMSVADIQPFPVVLPWIKNRRQFVLLNLLLIQLPKLVFLLAQMHSIFIPHGSIDADSIFLSAFLRMAAYSTN